MNHTQDTFQKFAKRSKAYDGNQERKADKKDGYKHMRNLKRWSEE